MCVCVGKLGAHVAGAGAHVAGAGQVLTSAPAVGLEFEEAFLSELR